MQTFVLLLALFNIVILGKIFVEFNRYFILVRSCMKLNYYVLLCLHFSEKVEQILMVEFLIDLHAKNWLEIELKALLLDLLTNTNLNFQVPFP